MPDILVHSEKIHEAHRGVYFGDLVYGANDGIVTAFAVVAGATGAGLSPGIIIILGVANLVADGISMGLSDFLSIRSRRAFEADERKKEEIEVKKFPTDERNEVRGILRRWGVPEKRLEEVLDSVTKSRKRWVDLMMVEELGIVSGRPDSPVRHGVATGLAFIAAGMLPLVPYAFGVPPGARFVTSIIATAAALFTVGALRTYVTHARWFRSGLEMLAVGGVAAAVAYVVGGAIKSAFHLDV